MKVAALSGGVGGAKLLDGLAAVLAPADLTAIVNTGDDFVHWGLHIAPDLDTVMYTLSGLGDQQRGWGLAGESFRALSMVERYGGESWFQLGDLDLGTHIVRTEALARGETLSAVTARMFRGVGVEHRVLPMSDERRATMIDTTSHGTLTFQNWFVRERTAPQVERVWFDGDDAPAPGVVEALAAADLVIVAPSNPYVSIDPILALRGVREAVAAKPTVAVSPIVHGEAVKGPLGAMITQLTGRAASAAAVAAHYGDLLDGMAVQSADGAPIRTLETGVIMKDRADRARLARDVLAFGEALL